MKIKQVKDTTEIYEREDIARVLDLCVVACTKGKLQSIAQSVYGKNQGRFYLIESDGVAQAVIGGTEIDRYTFVVKHIAVLGEARRKGYAKALVDHLIHERQYKRISIEVDEKAMLFFNAYGFTCKLIKNHPLDLQRYQCEWRP